VIGKGINVCVTHMKTVYALHGHTFGLSDLLLKTSNLLRPNKVVVHPRTGHEGPELE
jgi:hypothetical protein